MIGAVVIPLGFKAGEPDSDFESGHLFPTCLKHVKIGLCFNKKEKRSCHNLKDKTESSRITLASRVKSKFTW